MTAPLPFVFRGFTDLYQCWLQLYGFASQRYNRFLEELPNAQTSKASHSCKEDCGPCSAALQATSVPASAVCCIVGMVDPLDHGVGFCGSGNFTGSLVAHRQSFPLALCSADAPGYDVEGIKVVLGLFPRRCDDRSFF